MTEESKSESTGLTTETAPNELSIVGNQEVGQYNDGLTAEQLALLDDSYDQNADISELVFSRLAICQPGTPEVAEAQAGYSGGMLIDNKNREIYTQNTQAPWLIEKGVPRDEISKQQIVGAIVIAKLPTEYIKWIPKDDRVEGEAQFEWKTLDKTEQRVREGTWPPTGNWKAKQGEKNVPPVTTNMNFLVSLVDTDYNMLAHRIIVTFARTSYKHGRNLNTFLNGMRSERMLKWHRIYWFASKMEKGDGNTWYEINVAKGPDTRKVCPQYLPDIQKMALDLADRENGKALQELIINASDQTEDHSGGSGGDDDSSVSDVIDSVANEVGENDFTETPEF